LFLERQEKEICMPTKRPRIYRRSMPVQSLSQPLPFDNDLEAALASDTAYSKPSLCYSAKAYTERPEVALMRAVLADALDCFQKQFRPGGEREAQRLAREAEEWFFADDYNSLFSFVHISAVLGLDPEYIRRGLKRWRQVQSREKNSHSAS
ncbi:MAG: hypothetical protein ACRERD_29420, partial [Candidatus Binatia bacterium]